MTMSAYTVLDSVNKYRHGVLIGNFVEDKFGRDLNERGPNPDAPKIPTTKDHHDLNHSLYRRNQFLTAQNVDQSQSNFYQTSKNVTNDYKRPESQTTYKIFHQQEIHQKVPILENNPRREENQIQDQKLYQNTRHQLANKFVSQHSPSNHQPMHQDIPDILTGQIWKGKVNQGTDIKVDQKGKNKIQSQVQTKSINPYATYSLVRPQVQRFQQVQYAKFVYPHHKGQKRDVLFGHGLALEDFQKRQLSTTYDLSFNQQVMPQTQVNSFYNPDSGKSAKQFHKETVYEKNHQASIPVYGDKQMLNNEKAGRPYQPYTKTFDSNHLKHEYLRK